MQESRACMMRMCMIGEKCIVEIKVNIIVADRQLII